MYLRAGANCGVSDAIPVGGVDRLDPSPDVYGGVGMYSGGGDRTSVATGWGEEPSMFAIVEPDRESE